MTENKINFQLIDDELPVLIKNDLNMQDYLTSKKYNSKNIILDPFQVVWFSS